MGDEVIDKLVQAGVKLIPGGSLAQSIWSAVRPANAAERFDQAKRDYDDELAVRLVDAVRAVQGELRLHRTELDQLTPLRALAIAEQVAKSASEASGGPKVEAVLNAGARQFDPRLGPQETRKYWLDRVTQLTDLEVRVLMMLKEHAPLYYFVSSGELYCGEQREPAALDDEDRVALGSVLLEMTERIDLVTASGAIANIDQKSARPAILTPRGKTLVRFIEPIAGA